MLNLKPVIRIGTAAIASLAACHASGKGETVKPNVIFILLDDFGYTDLGCYGSTYYETPNIDRLAEEGAKFIYAYASCPVSSPTRASIMTGKYPVRTGITDWIPGRQASNSGSPDDKLVPLPFVKNLSLDETTIAEVLKLNGYKTMISGKWHLGETEEFWPESQGFEVNKGGFSKGSPVKNNQYNGYFSPYGNPRLEDGPDGEYLTDRQTDEAIKFIKSEKEFPFFVYLAYYSPHNPMQAKIEHVKKFEAKAAALGLDRKEAFTRNRPWIREDMSQNYNERIIQSNPVYAAMIWSIDENIGRLIACLRELGIDKNTIIFFTSDNGGLSTSEGSPTCNAPLRAGKGWLYEGGIRVPLIIKAPGYSKPGTEIKTPVTSVDFFPTIVAISGSEVNESDVDGVNIFPLLRRDKMAERPLFWHYPHYSNQGVEPGSAVRKGRYKLIDNFERERIELYDLAKDPSETNDLSAIMTEKREELFNLLKEWRIKTGAKMMIKNQNYISH